MASSRKRFTNDQVIAFFRGTKSSNEVDNEADETFSKYIWVDLACLQGDESPKAVTNDENAGAVRVRTFISFPAQEDMNLERPKSPDRREEMSESTRSVEIAILATRVVISTSTVDSMTDWPFFWTWPVSDSETTMPWWMAQHICSKSEQLVLRQEAKATITSKAAVTGQTCWKTFRQ